MSSLNQIEVPWEPYKAAINSKKSKNRTNFETGNLIRYKIDTDLNKFNNQRPGYQFDEFDFKLIDTNSIQETLNEVIKRNESKNSLSTNLAKELIKDGRECPNFIDARFYTDAHFLKLSNQLKKKSIKEIEKKVHKPVNIVGPMVEKKISEQTPRIDSNSLKIWKTQCENYQSRIDYLEEQIKGINEQLQIQTEVNAELKKLLVAAIGGEDMQYKMERLVNDKQRYEFELNSKTQLIQKLEEEIEQVSIQCDLWRSKFLASKLLAEENATWKSFLLMLNSQHEKSIKNLLEDNELINLKLNQVLDIVLDKPARHHNLNNLQALNTTLSNLYKKNPKFEINSINLSHGNQVYKKRSKTINEIAAEQVLEQFDWVKQTVKAIPSESETSLNMIENLDNLEILIKKIKENRNSKFSRLYQPHGLGGSELFLNCCINCNGNVKIV
ncbi:unnamed protein product [Brachionus calyciflorus]|uniref:Golgin-45 n=1 Tax=Brachionus calyciflorus TaxID=104777 RepID=A0A814ABX2_9BILA|nr:unnamed protein product [Brachionus calyciflorus]